MNKSCIIHFLYYFLLGCTIIHGIGVSNGFVCFTSLFYSLNFCWHTLSSWNQFRFSTLSTFLFWLLFLLFLLLWLILLFLFLLFFFLLFSFIILCTICKFSSKIKDKDMLICCMDCSIDTYQFISRFEKVRSMPSAWNTIIHNQLKNNLK